MIWWVLPNHLLKTIIRIIFCSIEVVAVNANRWRIKIDSTDLEQWFLTLKAESAISRSGEIVQTALSVLSPSQLPLVTGLPHPSPSRISTCSLPLQLLLFF